MVDEEPAQRLRSNQRYVRSRDDLPHEDEARKGLFAQPRGLTPLPRTDLYPLAQRH